MGIIKPLFNPPLPPFRKGGKKEPKLNAVFIVRRHPAGINPGPDILPFLSGLPGGIFSPLSKRSAISSQLAAKTKS
jgi:hypothetical protein